MKAKTDNQDYLQRQYNYEQTFHQKIMAENNATTRQALYLDGYGYAYQQSQEYSPDEIDFGFQTEEIDLIRPWLKNKVVVDYGCGYGSSTLAMAETACHVTGCDILDEVTSIARSRLTDKAINNITFKKVPPVDFPFEENSIDLVYASDVVEHFHPDDFSHWLKQVYSALKPGGKLIIITPHPNYGPSDISRNFLAKGAQSKGFHLLEYTYSALVTKLTDTDADFVNPKTPIISPRQRQIIPFYNQLIQLLWTNPQWRISAEQSPKVMSNAFLKKIIGLNRSVYLVVQKQV